MRTFDWRAPLAFCSAALLALPLAGGCAGFDWDGLAQAFSDEPQRELRVGRGYLAGRVGPTANLDHESDAQATSWGDTIDVTLTASTAAGAAMTILTLEGAQAFPGLATGDSVTVYDSHGPSGTGTRASVLGCAGPQVGQWQFDRSATSLVVQVEPSEAPGWYTYSFVASIPYNGPTGEAPTVVSGTFDLEVQAY